MKKKIADDSDEMRSEYDLSKLKFVGRGIYASDFAPGTNLVRLDLDVRAAFPDDESVNQALRALAKIAKQQASRARKSQRRNAKQPSKSRAA